MSAPQLSKRSSKVNPEVLNVMIEIAALEWWKFHTMFDEAFRVYLSKRVLSHSQKVMSHYLIMYEVVTY
jgi:hypothetical protein